MDALTGKVIVLIMLCIIVSRAEKWTSPMSFLCTRPTSPCMNSGTCRADGQCQCTGGYQGLRCDVLVSAMDMMALSCLDHDPCVNGECYDRGGGKGGNCLCRDEYYGTVCDQLMFDKECYEDRMVLYLLPWGYDVNTWSAGLEQPYLENTPAALLDTIEAFTQRHPDFAISDKRRGFVGQFLHVEDSAGSSARVEFRNETAITYSRTVVMSYSRSSMYTPERLTARCTLPYVTPTTSSRMVQSPNTPTTLTPPQVTTRTTPPISFYRPAEREWSGDFSVVWDCLRPTTPCYGSGDVCDFSGVCQCPTGQTGLDCSIPADRINQGDCAFSTLNPCDPKGGVCYDSGYGAMCACADGYYGDHCQHPMVQTVCSPLHMVVNVFPYGYDNWPHRNLRPNLRPDGRCPMKTVGELTSAQPELTSPRWEGFADVYLHVNDPCARDADIVSENATTRVYSRRLEVNYTTPLSHYLDHSVVVTCPVLLRDLPPTPSPTPPASSTHPPPTTTTTTPLPTPPPTTLFPPTTRPSALVDFPAEPESTPRSTNPRTTTSVPPAGNSTQGLTATAAITTTPSPAYQSTKINATAAPPLRPEETSPGATLPDGGQGHLTPSISQGQTTGSIQHAGIQLLPSPRVSITLKDENMNRVLSAVKLGSLVLAVFSLHPLNNNKGVTDIRVESCVVSSQVTGKEFLVVKNSCAQQPMGMLLYSKKEGTRILIMKVMRFPAAVKLNFSCRIRMCAFNDSTCQQSRTCSDRFPRSVQNTVNTDSNNWEVTERLQSVTQNEDPAMTSVVETILIGY